MAKQFTDATGRAWPVPVNVSTIKRARDLVDVNLLDIVADNGALMQKLSTDPIVLCNVLYCLCKDQADREGLTDYQFGELLAGDCLEAATLALLEGLADFFPKAKRELLRTALGKLEAYQGKIIGRLQARIESPELAAQIEAQIERDFEALNKQFTNSPASSA